MELGTRKRQQVLAMLLCHPNSPVPVDLLFEALWEDSPPRTARKNLQVYVSGLRALLGATPARPVITHGANGYMLAVDEDGLDWLRFEEKVRDCQRRWNTDRTAVVAESLRAALALWRGRALDGLHGTIALDEAAKRLDGRFLTVFEDWAEAELAGGVSVDIAERIAAVAERHPFRERLRIAQMVALNQLGRRTEALSVFDEVRRSLAGEFGIAPSAALTELHRSLLREHESSPPPSTGKVILRSAGGCPLPRDLPEFTGRGDQTRELVGALADGGDRLAVIAGPAGVGKTALAVHVAHRLRDHFPDGCYFVRLRREDGTPRSPEEIVSLLVWATNAAGGGAHRADATVSWQRWLVGHRALLVFDDARHESEVRPLLPEAGESAVIVSSRRRLVGLGAAHRCMVPDFDSAAALDLLRRIIGARRVDADEKSAERIVLEVGLLPLAVRVIGDKLAGLDHLPLGEYLVRVEGAASPLDELTVGDVTVRARLAAAVADLPLAAGDAFRRLGSLPRARFTLSEGAKALGVAEETAVRTLESLLEAGIVAAPDAETVARDVVYEMPVLTHAYARELAGQLDLGVFRRPVFHQLAVLPRRTEMMKHGPRANAASVRRHRDQAVEATAGCSAVVC